MLLRKKPGFNVVWTHDLTIPVRCSSQLSYKATDVGSWSIMCSYVPLKEMNVTDEYEMNRIRSAEMKADEEWSLQLWTQFMQLRKKPEKNSGLQWDFNWTCECVVLVRCSDQLSYEATDVGSWSVMCSYVPVKEMNVTDVYEINHISTAEMKSSEEWSLQLWMQFMQLRKKPEKKKSGLPRGLSLWSHDAGVMLLLGLLFSFWRLVANLGEAVGFGIIVLRI